MDPITMTGIALSAGASMLGAVSQAGALRAQGAAGQQKAAIEQQWAYRRANEERAAAQRSAYERLREGKIAESRLVARAGSSGSRVDDPTVQDLYGDIAQEAAYNAAKETAAGEQRAAGLTYGANLGAWGADAEAQIRNASAQNTLIGGILGAAGSGLSAYSTAMGRRYYDPSVASYNYGGSTGAYY